MKYLSLFSGIGAPEKALDRLGIPYELVGYSEIDKYASRSYAAIHGVSEDMNLGDITKIDETKLPKDIDLCFYGFPCQDISIAGNQKGLFNSDGTQTRSGLFFEALRIIEETKPSVAIAENVKNLTGKKFAGQFKLVLDSLEAAGYNNYWKVLNAKDFGVPQNRERVFIVSIRKDVDNGTFQFPEGFPLKLRLKDVLEDEVDERYYLSKKMIDYVTADVDGCGFGGDINPEIARSLNATMGKMHRAGVDNYVSDTCVRQIGNCCPTKTRVNPNQGHIYDTEGLSPSLTCMGGGNRQPFVIDGEPKVKKVWKLNSSQDGIVVSPDGIAPCHTSGHGNTPKVLVTEPQVKQVCKCTTRGSDVSSTIRASIYKQGGRNLIENVKNGRGYEGVMEIGKDLRIRKLTPKECFRLMDFDDSDYEKAASVNSNAQLYKQAGNSIVVAVPKFIIAQLLEYGVLNA